jgi:hypothetical protein
MTDHMVDENNAHNSTATSQLSAAAVAEPAIETREPIGSDGVRISLGVSTEPGEGVNRFLLCTLVSASAKHIKVRADRIGERLPMASIIKSVLRSYQSAAKLQPGLLTGSALNQAGLRSLIEQVMKEEIRHHAQARVAHNRARLTQASKLGDEVRIKAETEGLELAIASRNRLTTEFM